MLDRENRAPDKPVDQEADSKLSQIEEIIKLSRKFLDPEPVDIEEIMEWRREIKGSIQDQLAGWQARGLIDEQWMQAYKAFLDDPWCPPPPPPSLGGGGCSGPP